MQATAEVVSGDFGANDHFDGNPVDRVMDFSLNWEGVEVKATADDKNSDSLQFHLNYKYNGPNQDMKVKINLLDFETCTRRLEGSDIQPASPEYVFFHPLDSSFVVVVDVNLESAAQNPDLLIATPNIRSDNQTTTEEHQEVLKEDELAKLETEELESSLGETFSQYLSGDRSRDPGVVLGFCAEVTLHWQDEFVNFHQTRLTMDTDTAVQLGTNSDESNNTPDSPPIPLTKPTDSTQQEQVATTVADEREPQQPDQENDTNGDNADQPSDSEAVALGEDQEDDTHDLVKDEETSADIDFTIIIILGVSIWGVCTLAAALYFLRREMIRRAVERKIMLNQFLDVESSGEGNNEDTGSNNNNNVTTATISSKQQWNSHSNQQQIISQFFDDKIPPPGRSGRRRSFSRRKISMGSEVSQDEMLNDFFEDSLGSPPPKSQVPRNIEHHHKEEASVDHSAITNSVAASRKSGPSTKSGTTTAPSMKTRLSIKSGAPTLQRANIAKKATFQKNNRDDTSVTHSVTSRQSDKHQAYSNSKRHTVFGRDSARISRMIKVQVVETENGAFIGADDVTVASMASKASRATKDSRSSKVSRAKSLANTIYST